MRDFFSFMLCSRHLAMSGSEPDSRCQNYLSSNYRLGYHSSKYFSKRIVLGI